MTHLVARDMQTEHSEDENWHGRVNPPSISRAGHALAPTFPAPGHCVRGRDMRTAPRAGRCATPAGAQARARALRAERCPSLGAYQEECADVHARAIVDTLAVAMAFSSVVSRRAEGSSG
jgi:hypothetical protein